MSAKDAGGVTYNPRTHRALLLVLQGWLDEDPRPFGVRELEYFMRGGPVRALVRKAKGTDDVDVGDLLEVFAVYQHRELDGLSLEAVLDAEGGHAWTVGECWRPDMLPHRVQRRLELAPASDDDGGPVVH